MATILPHLQVKVVNDVISSTVTGFFIGFTEFTLWFFNKIVTLVCKIEGSNQDHP
uniref:Uncharacterized protein n=1 Tax=Tetranychus urticae TaxID=32264 RepID=T1KX33_TETUR